MRESELLAHIALRSQNLRDRFAHVLVGPGDDCAVVRTPNADQLLLTTDHLVEGRHFEPLDLVHKRWMLDLVARKAIARSISDIAAMGGTPLCSLATACLPPNFPQDAANELFDHMHKWAEHWNAPLVGGDISSFAALGGTAVPAVSSSLSPSSSSPTPPRGAGVPPASTPSTSSLPPSAPLVLTTTVLGTPHKSGAILRSTARPGDAIYVTGNLGGSQRDHRHLLFEPRLAEATWLLDVLGNGIFSMMDLSDGLGRDAARLGRASGMRLEIDATLLPLSPGSDWRSALSDGEDYELLFTTYFDMSDMDHLLRDCPIPATKLTRIGTARQAPGIGQPSDSSKEHLPFSGCIVKTPEGSWIDASELGWEHT